MSTSADAVPLTNNGNLPLREGRPPAAATDRVFQIGRAFLVLQLVWLIVFSTVLFTRDALTFDFSIFNQARWLIVHGQLDPFDTVVGYRYFDSHGELLMWPLAEVTRLPPHGLMLLWAQDVAAVGCELVVLSWARVVLRASSWSSRAASVALGALAVMLVADPWSYVSVAFDFHFEVIGAFFALLAARDLWRGRPAWAWLWAALTWTAGDVCTLYIVGVSATALVATRHRRAAAAMLLLTLAWFGFLTAIHADRGSGLASGYGYLAGRLPVGSVRMSQIAVGALHHPGRVIGHMWSDRGNLWANASPAGLAGLASIWGLVPAAVALIPGALAEGHLFAVPSFQNFLAYPFLGLGTILAADRLRQRPRCRRCAPLLVATCAAVTLAWAAVWLPRYPSTWLKVDPSAGRLLDGISGAIPRRAEVVVSQGVAGRLSGRPDVRLLLDSVDRVPLDGQIVYFVLAPDQGIEMPVAETEAVLLQVSELSGSTLVMQRAGIWVWRWRPSPGQHVITLGRSTTEAPAWTFPGAAGVGVTTGPVADWYVAANGRAGYIVARDYWYERRGAYQATVDLAASSEVSVEVWNASTGELLARRLVSATSGHAHVTVAFRQALRGSAPVFRGLGILRIQPVPPPQGWPVEIRVFTKAGGTVSVYSVAVRAR